MPGLFDTLTLRGVTLRNRVGVSPMCQYSSVDGFVNSWHLVHLGSRAVGGAGLVVTEGTAVLPEGRITPSDLGLWEEAHIPGHRELARFLAAQGAVPAIQLAHAGRKASRVPPWESDPGQTQGRPLTMDEGGWQPDGASSLAFDAGYTVPNELSVAGIARVVEAFALAAQRAAQAGYEWVEVHGAHGYLLHSFNSPVSNSRTDAYGGSLEGRCRITREVAQAIRRVLPDDCVLAFRLSFTDWVDGGWSARDAVQLARWLKEDGVDLIDVSSGGSVPRPQIPVGPGYQVPGAAAVRQGALIPVAAVGLIDKAEQADSIVREGSADVVMLAREMLRDPYWPLRAAVELQRCDAARMPVQYNSAWGHLGTFSFDPITAPRITESGIDRVDRVRRNALV